MKASKEMCIYCFDELISHFDKSHLRKIKLVPKEWEDQKFPLFITWKTQNDKLRGCIGTFKSESLEISKYIL